MDRCERLRLGPFWAAVANGSGSNKAVSINVHYLGRPMLRPLKKALRNVWVFRFVDPGRRSSGDPREAP